MYKKHFSKVVIALAVMGTMSGCGMFSTRDNYERRADEERERQEKLVERSIDKAPKWMTDLPQSKDAVYANGTAVSGDFGMADAKAKMMAYSKVCMAAGGQVSQQGKVFMQDSRSSTTELSELAIKSFCASVDITGVETREIKRIAEGNRYRSYVLIALPVGAANPMQARKDGIAADKRAETRSKEAFIEIEKADAIKAKTD